jgi:hypothetical protein
LHNLFNFFTTLFTLDVRMASMSSHLPAARIADAKFPAPSTTRRIVRPALGPALAKRMSKANVAKAASLVCEKRFFDIYHNGYTESKGYFLLSAQNPFGCWPCFCFGHSSVCSTADGFYSVNISSDLSAADQDGFGFDGWTAKTIDGKSIEVGEKTE